MLTLSPMVVCPSITVLVPIKTSLPIDVFSLMVTPCPVLKSFPISTSLYIIEVDSYHCIFANYGCFRTHFIVYAYCHIFQDLEGS